MRVNIFHVWLPIDMFVLCVDNVANYDNNIKHHMLTGRQIRAARAALSISAEQLALMCSISLRTIQRIELADGVPDGRISTIVAVKNALERAGIEFIGTPEDRPGIRVAVLPQGEGLTEP